MTVGDLIEELKKMSPLLPVRVKVHGDTYWEEEHCTEVDGGEGDLDDVRFDGNHVSLEAKHG